MSDPLKEPDLLPELAGVALSGIPLVGPFAEILGERVARAVAREWRQNTSRVLKLAQEHSGLSREDLAELIDSDPRIVPLITRTLYAAGMNGQDKTLLVLAGFLGQAMGDTSKVDEVHLLLGGLEDLSEHHIGVLELLITDPRDHPQLPVSETHWTTGTLSGVVPMRNELVSVAVQGLLAAGFARDAGIDGGSADPGVFSIETSGMIIEITQLGRTVLEVLNSLAPGAAS